MQKEVQHKILQEYLEGNKRIGMIILKWILKKQFFILNLILILHHKRKVGILTK